MTRFFLLAALASGAFVAASGAPRAEQSSAPAPSTPRAEPSSPGQSDVEAQLAKMLEQLRRDNARRGVAVDVPAPPAAAPVVSRPVAPAVVPAAPRAVAPEPPRVEPAPPESSTPITVPSTTRSLLPPLEGFTSDEVRAFLGAPHTIQQGAAGITAWYYATPNGRLPVYFIGDLATVTLPAAKRGVPLPTLTRRAPGRIGACHGIGATTGLKALTVARAESPAFIEPRLRAVPLTMLAVGVKLEVVATEGAWYLARFSDERWGKRVGYVHCSDVAPVQP